MGSFSQTTISITTPNIAASEAQVSLQQSLQQNSAFDVILTHINHHIIKKTSYYTPQINTVFLSCPFQAPNCPLSMRFAN
jgi:hypothetical protein